jgi:chemotaxis family two-component system response regulator Rcp1
MKAGAVPLSARRKQDRNMSHAPSSTGLFLVKSLTPLEVLIVESNPVDALRTITAFRAAGLTNGIHCVRDGEDALSYLRREGRYTQARIPDLIFLDLAQPRVSGLQALKIIRSTPALKHIPVVVAADAEEPAFIQAVYSMHGNGFIRKPPDLLQFLRCIESCYEYWVSIVTLERQPRRRSHDNAEAPAVTIM